MKTLGIINNKEEVKAFHSLLKQKGITFYTTSPLASIACREAGMPIRELDEHQNFEDIATINKVAHHLATTWWKDKSIMRQLPFLHNFNGVPIGEMLTLGFYHSISLIARSIITMRRCIRKEKPDKIIMCKSPSLKGSEWSASAHKFYPPSFLQVFSQEKIYTALLSPVSLPFGLKSSIRTLFERFKNTVQSKKERDSWHYTSEKKFKVLSYYQSRHGDQLLPLFKALAADKDVYLILLKSDLTRKGKERAKEWNIPVFDPLTLWEASDESEVHRTTLTAKKKMETLVKKVKLTSLFYSDDINCSLYPLIQFQLDWLKDNGIRDIVKRILLAEKTMDCLQPDLLITPVDGSITDQCWIFPAKKRKIPTLTPVHGSISLEPSEPMWGWFQADYWATWGEITTRWYLAQGYPKERIQPCGCPFLDEERNLLYETRPNEIKGRLALPPASHILLFLSSMGGGAHASYFKSFLQIYELLLNEVKKLKHISLIIRCHPASDTELPSLLAKTFPVQCIVQPPESLISLLSVSDVVIAQPTTAAIEAMFVQKPVLLFQIGMAKENNWWLNFGDLEVIRRPEEITRKVDKYLNNKKAISNLLMKQNEFLKREIQASGDEAINSTVKFVKMILRKQKGLKSINHSLT